MIVESSKPLVEKRAATTKTLVWLYDSREFETISRKKGSYNSDISGAKALHS